MPIIGGSIRAIIDSGLMMAVAANALTVQLLETNTPVEVSRLGVTFRGWEAVVTLAVLFLGGALFALLGVHEIRRSSQE